jgi:hypothetical protein
MVGAVLFFNAGFTIPAPTAPPAVGVFFNAPLFPTEGVVTFKGFGAVMCVGRLFPDLAVTLAADVGMMGVADGIAILRSSSAK